MRKIFSIMAFSCVVIFTPFALASPSPQPQRGIDQNIVAENLCDPDFNTEFNEEWMPFALDYQQLERVRIELLERGFNPGFNRERDAAGDAQLMETVARFQSEYRLPVTGTIDASTLAGLNVPIQKYSPSEELTQRAKRSK